MIFVEKRDRDLMAGPFLADQRADETAVEEQIDAAFGRCADAGSADSFWGKMTLCRIKYCGSSRDRLSLSSLAGPGYRPAWETISPVMHL